MKLVLIGWPLGHSLSPVFQNSALRANGLSGEYALLPVPPERDLGDVMAELRADPDWMGANVTVPYKEKVIPFLDGLAGAAQSLRAVNTIVREGGRLIGHNTDLPGFLGDLARNGIACKDVPALVLGSGGAARAVVLGLVESGCAVTLVAEILDQAEMLARELGAGRVIVLGWADAGLAEAAAHAKLLVNATPVGMAPKVDESPWPADLAWPADAAAYDLVYNPRETKFLAQAHAHGLRTASGLGMLVEQGARAFELWTGKPAPRAVMLAAAETAASNS